MPGVGNLQALLWLAGFDQPANAPVQADQFVIDRRHRPRLGVAGTLFNYGMAS
jgi:hypothetical protein